MISEVGSNSLLELAVDEIWRNFGHRVAVNRKSIQKYGRNESVGSTEEDITTLGGSENYLSTNGINRASSSDGGDTGEVSYEGMTISGGSLTFVSDTFTLNGQNKVVLPTPVRCVTRARGDVDGNVYFYQDGTISGGVPTNLALAHNVLVGGDNTTLRAATSTQSTNYLILFGYWAAMGKAGGSAAADIRLKSRVVGSEFTTLEVRSLSLGKDVRSDFAYLIIPPNSDIAITGVSSGTSLDIFAGFFGVFADIIT